MIQKIGASDGSVIWTKRLTLFSQSDENPTICAFNNYLYIVWQRHYGDNNYDIMLVKASVSDGSVEWFKRLTLYGDCDLEPSIYIFNGYIYVAWRRCYDGNNEIMLMKVDANDGSIVWIERLTAYSQSDESPQVFVYNYYVYVAWCRYYGSNTEIMLMKVSISSNVVWIKRLTISSSSDCYPTLCAYRGYVYVAWRRCYDGNNEIMLMKVSADDGSVEWVKRLTAYAGSDERPRVYVHDGYVYVTWMRDYGGSGGWEDLLMKVNASTGDCVWLNRVTVCSVDDYNPSLYVSGEYVYIVESRAYSSDSEQIVLHKIAHSVNKKLWRRYLTIYSSVDNDYNPEIVIHDGYAYITWFRESSSGDCEVLLQKISPSTKTIAWMVRVSSGQGEKYPSMCVYDGCVYLAWEKNYTNNWEIMLAKIDMENGEIEWIKRLTVFSDDDKYVHICAYNGYIYVTWMRSYISGGSWEIMLQKVSASDGSIIWTKRLTTYHDLDKNPTICAYNNYLYIAWQRHYGEYYNFEILLAKVSTNDGSVEWVKCLTAYDNYDGLPKVCAYNGYIYVAWQRDYSSTGYDIMLAKVSASDGSAIWVKRLTAFDDDDASPSICIYNGYAYITWHRYYGSNIEIMLQKISASDGSIIWTKRLTTYDNYDYNPSIHVYNNYAYIVWHRYYDSNAEVMLMKASASDGSVEWTRRLTTYSENDRFPWICACDNYVYIVWNRVGSGDILMQKIDAVNGSIIWTKCLTTYIGIDDCPSACAYNGYIYVAWIRHYNVGDYEIMLMKVDASDGSVIWVKRLTTYSDRDIYPCVHACSGYVYVTWQRYYSDYNYEIMLAKVSASDGSVAWIKRLTTFSDSDIYPTVFAYNGYVYVTWQRYYGSESGKYEIMLQKISASDGSIEWTRRLTTHSDSDYRPWVYVYNDYVYIAWHRYYGSNAEIMLLKISIIGGPIRWIKRLTTYSDCDYSPTMSIYSGFIYITWYRLYSATSGGWEVLFQKVNATDGSIIWTKRLTTYQNGDESPRICICNGYIYITWQRRDSSGRYHVALERHDGGQ